MTKVWVLTLDIGSEYTLIGVYSTPQLAGAAMEQFSKASEQNVALPGVEAYGVAIEVWHAVIDPLDSTVTDIWTAAAQAELPREVYEGSFWAIPIDVDQMPLELS